MRGSIPQRDRSCDYLGSFAARTSTRWIAGASANRSEACAISAAAIGPAKCACRPDSSGNASKMPNVDGPIRRANHAVVAGSACASGRPPRRNVSTAASLPGLAFNRTYKATVTMNSSVVSLFEAHLPVADLDTAIAFYQNVVRLRLAYVTPERQAAFLWIGQPGNAMLGLWAAGASPQRTTLHIAFRASVEDVAAAPLALRTAGTTPLDFDGQPTDEPVVIAWM